MAKLQTVGDGGRFSGHNDHNVSTIELSKKEGVKYCYICGKECSSDSILCCGKNNFMMKGTSEIIGGYIELAKNDNIKKYYEKNRRSKSVIKMNPKRMIHQLLLHKEKLDVKKETVDKIYIANVTQLPIGK